MDFSLITQSPEIRPLVQEGALERAFHDALFPRMLFRGEATPVLFPGNVGDSMIFTGVGLRKSKQKPLSAGTDPVPSKQPYEQWSMTIEKYADTDDVDLPTSYVAIANQFLRAAHQMGLGAAQSMNRVVRNRLYAAALSGSTVAISSDGSTPQSGTSLYVNSINGFTRARRPDLSTGSPVRFDPVSANNPLKIKLWDNGAEVSRLVTGATADNAGDETGPGTLTLSVGTTSVAHRAYVIADDRSAIVRPGGGNSVVDVGSGDVWKLAQWREAVAKMWNNNVSEFPDGCFHCHMDPISQTQIFADAEFQRLNTGLPDYVLYKQFCLGQFLGTLAFRNSECPQPATVDLATVTPPAVPFDENDPFPGELYSTGLSTTGVEIHRPLFLGQGLIHEYYIDLIGGAFLSEAGVTGRTGQFRITNNAIEVNTDRVQLIIRAPLDRLQDQVSVSWKFCGDWPARTDITTGGAERYKRSVVVEHA